MRPRGAPSTEDVRLILGGLAPGGYRTRDLYPRYVALVDKRGQEPSTVKALGEALRRFFGPAGDRRQSANGNVTVWRITEEMTQGDEPK